jgi:hypothetical protein
LCYFLYIASPLTLSEVRSMLPHGAHADLASFADQQILKLLHYDSQTVARILIGRCSCDFVRPRLADPQEDERHLRERYRKVGVPRTLIIKALEQHRRGHSVRARVEPWSRALVKFVAEHARNAGPTLYHLHFSPDTSPLPPPGEIRRLSLKEVLANPEAWLVEGSPVLVSR